MTTTLYPITYRTADGRRTAELTYTTVTVFEGCKIIATVPATEENREYPGSVWDVINAAVAPEVIEPVQNPGAEEPTEATTHEGTTREDVEPAVEEAMQWLRFPDREGARSKPAADGPGAEFKRNGRVMRRALKRNGPIVCLSAIKLYARRAAALAAARRFQACDSQSRTESSQALF